MLVELLVLAGTLLSVYAFRVYLEYRRVRGSVRDILTFVTFFSNETTLASALNKSTRLVLGQFNFWLRKHDLYEPIGWNISAAEIGSQRHKYPKPLAQYKPLDIFGRNIISTEGEEWKKNRKIASPAFSERNNRLVWEESIRMLTEFFDEVWGDKEEIAVDNFLGLSLQFGLRVISAAGFGRRMGWSAEHTVPQGHELSFEETFQIASKDVYLKLLLPDWVPNLTERIRKTRIGFDELRVYLQDVIHQRKSTGSTAEIDQVNLFSNLIDANEQVGEEMAKLDDSELIGNVFVFLLAGHETSSHTLCFAFALLALYPEEQDKLYQHIMSVCPDRLPAYDDIPALDRSLAVIYETLRLFPPAVGVPKSTAEDTSFVLHNEQGQSKVIPVPKNTNLVIHAAGVHYNPRYWKDPYEFRPDRFMGEWNRDAFIPFSVGARSCIGRRFSEVESVAILSVLVKKYKISVMEEPEFKHESFEGRKERVLKAQFGITHTYVEISLPPVGRSELIDMDSPIRVPLTFTRRK
ncbi:hypothetical protein PM082_018061 [Marasmius tenuissimus]|nr:hypothetical protein PM082_018061 [Marasmius tenuissimus]